MRLIVGIVMLLLGVGLLTCQMEGGSANSALPDSQTQWVRTIDGWERAHNWSPSLVGPPALHPLVLAAGQTLFSVFALAAAAGFAERAKSNA